jgi:hypothetical protein
MAGHYYIIAFDSPYGDFSHYWDDPRWGHYLGETSDLEFKVEPDKTVELDNGLLEVHSEKLSLSFSILGEIQNPGLEQSFCNIWLIPDVGDGEVKKDIINIMIRSEYSSANRGWMELEEKSGEFGRHNYKLEMRYDVNHPRFNILEGNWYLSEKCILLMENIEKENNQSLEIKCNEILAYEYDAFVDLYMKGKIAIIGLVRNLNYEIKLLPSGEIKNINNSDIIRLQW